ncbi:MAG: class I SAM-dependent methyltransferase [bacterium]
MSKVFDERLVLNSKTKENIIYDEHLVRYIFASKFVKDKIVLDVACGSGYGAQILANAGAKEITAIDASEEALVQARKNNSKENIKYIFGKAEDVKENDQTFNLIASFETIEHLKPEDHDKFLSELARVLKSDGRLIISTPNKKVFLQKNPYHLKEYLKDEFTTALNKHFKYCKILEQFNGLASCLTTESETSQIIMPNNFEPLYFVAVCSHSELEKINEKNILSINPIALNNIYNNLKIIDKIYSMLVKIPGVKKLFEIIK